MLNFKTAMEYFGYVANIVAVLGIPYSLYQILQARKEYKRNQEIQKIEEKRRNDLIEIIMHDKDSNKKIILPGKVRRSQLSRQEIMGRLGAIPKKHTPKEKPTQSRFQIQYTNTKAFLESIDHCYVSTEKQLHIECSNHEIDQFDKEKMPGLGFIITGL